MSQSLCQPHLHTTTILSSTPPPHTNHRDPKPTTIPANTNPQTNHKPSHNTLKKMIKKPSHHHTTTTTPNSHHTTTTRTKNTLNIQAQTNQKTPTNPATNPLKNSQTNSHQPPLCPLPTTTMAPQTHISHHHHRNPLPPRTTNI